MKDQVFGSGYADQYDLFYKDKNYEAECDMIEEIFRCHASGQVSTILDLGCGTGNHAIPLARRGYQVTGIDRSHDMLAIAKNKAKIALQSGIDKTPAFIKGDVRSLDLEQTFDVVLMMFAVLGYQTTNADVLAALQIVRRHSRPGGLFICDVWYGPAVLAIRPGDRVKVIAALDGKVIRVASGSLDVYHQIANIHYNTWTIKEKTIVSEEEETHRMRYFFPQELELFFAQSDMKVLKISSFDNPKKSPTEQTWNCLAVGQAK